jgi:hypothetical protein
MIKLKAMISSSGDKHMNDIQVTMMLEMTPQD